MRNRLSLVSIALSVVFAIAIANFARLSVQAMSKQIQVNVARAQTRAVTEATRVEADARVTVRATVIAASNAAFAAERPPEPGQIIPLAPAETIPVTILPTPTAEPTERTIDPTRTAMFYADVFRALAAQTDVATAGVVVATPTPAAIPTPAPTDDFVDPTLAVIVITPLIPTDTYEPTLTLTPIPTFTFTPMPTPPPTDVPKATAVPLPIASDTPTPLPTETATTVPIATVTSSPLDSPLATPTSEPTVTPITTETPAP